jgi:hypothetical protein
MSEYQYYEFQAIDRLLVEAATRGVHPRMELLRGLGETRNTVSSRQPEPRTVAELLAAADGRAGARQPKAAERAAREQAVREREVAEARERHLARLAKEGAEAWRRVDALVATRRPAANDEAASLLRDLREIGARDGRAAEVESGIQALREEHARKQNFLLRLKRIGL